MQKLILSILAFAYSVLMMGQTSSRYEISFENAVHHEAEIRATFTGLNGDVELHMSRTSPGRYALHEFVKNVYNIKVLDGNGNALNVVRKDPYSWMVTGHDGTINLSYTLFANHGDGTYSQVDETHAHLNIPATFMYVPQLSDKGIEVSIDVREDLNWKVATQLPNRGGNRYAAKNFQYFMDSPIEISDHDIRSFVVDGQTINLVLHHNGTEEELNQYFEQVKPIVLEQKAVFGELPKFDYKNYYFLACYIPNASGDGMEHRNSTYLTSTRALAQEGMSRNIGTVSHEFFHVWNVERIRPTDLEPFDFSKANMSTALWFAEGFTSYYTGLILCRAGIRTPEDYIASLEGTFNYVWNSPGRQFFNPLEMSQQAPFVDAARSVDPNNRRNTFISYYSYGSALGLALDLALREKGLNLDDYMKMVWFTFGKEEIPYKISDLQQVLMGYAGKEFSDSFFSKYIFNSEMPDMKRLFDNVGISLTQNPDKVWFGVSMSNGKISRNTTLFSPAYTAGLEKGDILLKIGESTITSKTEIDKLLETFNVGESVKILFERFGKQKETQITFTQDPTFTISTFENSGLELTEAQKQARSDWLSSKRN